MGVVYYKRISTYEGDITADRSLRCDEVDGNFYFLRGYDIDTIGFDAETNILQLQRVNGDKLTVDLTQPAGDVSFSFDEATGTLYVTTPDGTKSIADYVSADDGVYVAVDGTLEGNGMVGNPLRISSIERTGMLSAADEYRDLNESDTTLTPEDAETEHIRKGYRILTKEKTTKFGYLYNFESVKAINQALEGSNWRVPSKDDWDKMLNSIEDECSEAPIHGSDTSNAWLGEKAGQKLKATWMWKPSTPETTGTDEYGFEALPLGYIDSDVTNLNAFKASAVFWTSTIEDDNEDVWTKRLDFDHADVRQSSWEPECYLSLRLVKDWDGAVYESEYIPSLGVTTPCVVIGDMVWTKTNVSAKQFEGIVPDEWSELTPEEKDTREVFYLNEWNGKTWTKRQLTDGQTIILKAYNDPQQGLLEYHEFITLSRDGGIHVELMDFASFIEGASEERIHNLEVRSQEQAQEIAALQEQLATANTRIDDLVSALTETNERITELINSGFSDIIRDKVVNMLWGSDRQITLYYLDSDGFPTDRLEAEHIKIGFAPDAQFVAGD